MRYEEKITFKRAAKGAGKAIWPFMLVKMIVLALIIYVPGIPMVVQRLLGFVHSDSGNRGAMEEVQMTPISGLQGSSGRIWKCFT